MSETSPHNHVFSDVFGVKVAGHCNATRETREVQAESLTVSMFTFYCGCIRFIYSVPSHINSSDVTRKYLAYCLLVCEKSSKINLVGTMYLSAHYQDDQFTRHFYTHQDRTIHPVFDYL